MDPLQISRKEASKKIELLTPRQHEVLFLLACGHSRKEIAIKLNITKRTVREHISNACFRLGTDKPIISVMLMVHAQPEAYSHICQ